MDGSARVAASAARHVHCCCFLGLYFPWRHFFRDVVHMSAKLSNQAHTVDGVGASRLAFQHHCPAAADAHRSPLASWVDKSPDNHQFCCMKQPIMTKFILSPKNSLAANLKSILPMALILAFCGLAGAQGEKADPIGTWKCEYKIGDQQRTSTLTITKDGDKLAGTMSWPAQKDAKLKDVKL